jgi:hypothetical protein
MLKLVLFIILLILSLFNIFDKKVYTGGNNSTRTNLFSSNDYDKLFNKYTSMVNIAPTVTVKDIPQALKYRSHNQIYRTSYHIGQRKLFLNELQFLTNELKSINDVAMVVYAGSNPSNHIWFLHTLFPNVKFLLVDPNECVIHTQGDKSHYLVPKNEIVYLKHNSKNNPKNLDKKVFYLQDSGVEFIQKQDANNDNFNIKNALKFIIESSARVFVYEDYYTTNLSLEIKNILGNVYFWSDIRTNSSADGGAPNDVDICFNLAQQYNWIKELTPIKYMLKFRMPFFTHTYENFKAAVTAAPYAAEFDSCDIDFSKIYKDKKLEYLCGDANIQCWAGATSTETRLVGSGLNLCEYDCNEYDNKFFFYNSILRPFCLHKNSYLAPALGFDLCGDCALEALIWENYVKKFSINTNIRKFVKKLCIVTKRTLLQSGHGELFTNHSKEKFMDNLKNYQ